MAIIPTLLMPKKSPAYVRTHVLRSLIEKTIVFVCAAKLLRFIFHIFAAQHVPTFSGNPDEDIDVFLLEFDSTCDTFALDEIPCVDRIEDHTAEDR